ncbi:hypothetical protein GCM10027256_39420 [Novispirillum itersonii subsp. nipponicum]
MGNVNVIIHGDLVQWRGIRQGVTVLNHPGQMQGQSTVCILKAGGDGIPGGGAAR